MRHLVLLLALVGCDHRWPVRGPVTVDDNVTDMRLLVALWDGADAWCTATGGVACVTWEHSRNGDVHMAHRARGNAAYIPSAGTLELDLSKIRPMSWGTVIRHELGHAFGLPHAPYGLMQGDVRWTRGCIDEATLRAFCTMHGCPSTACAECR